MKPERWSLRHDGRLHEVHVRRRGPALEAAWRVDGELVAQEKEWEKTLYLSPSDESSMIGAVGVKGPTTFSATRRVVLHPGRDADPSPDTAEDGVKADDNQDESPAVPAAASLRLSFDRGAIDLVPDEGTRAARRQDWILRHPRLHVVRETFTAGGAVMWGVIFFGVVVPVLDRLIPDVEGPDINAPDINFPSIPWPDLPSMTWPDLPSVPWPDLPDLPDLPDWVGTVVKLLLAVTLAGLVASGEVKRRREREQRSQSPSGESHAAGSGAAGSGAAGSDVGGPASGASTSD